jgi:hypothetical protein
MIKSTLGPCIQPVVGTSASDSAHWSGRAHLSEVFREPPPLRRRLGSSPKWPLPFTVLTNWFDLSPFSDQIPTPHPRPPGGWLNAGDLARGREARKMHPCGQQDRDLLAQEPGHTRIVEPGRLLTILDCRYPFFLGLHSLQHEGGIVSVLGSARHHGAAIISFESSLLHKINHAYPRHLRG